MNRLFGNKKKKKHQNEEMGLNITAMADIFTIILVFLLKSFATGALTITPSEGSKLPIAEAQDAALEAIKLEITANTVLVDDQPVATLKQFVPDAGFQKGINQALEKAKQRQALIAQNNPDVKVDPKILIVADQKTPYNTIKQVLASAATQGYSDFKLAVVRKE